MGFEEQDIGINAPSVSQSTSSSPIPMGVAFTEIPINEKKKAPKRILHFSDGVLEEYSTDEDEDIDEAPKIMTIADPKTMTWAPYLWYLTLSLGSKTLAVCDYLGENLAHFFGITTPKYQYEIDEYQRMLQEEEEERERAEQEIKSGWVTTPLPRNNSESEVSSCQTVVESLDRIEVEPSSLSLNLSPAPTVSFPNTPSTAKDSKEWERF